MKNQMYIEFVAPHDRLYEIYEWKSRWVLLNAIHGELCGPCRVRSNWPSAAFLTRVIVSDLEIEHRLRRAEALKG